MAESGNFGPVISEWLILGLGGILGLVYSWILRMIYAHWTEIPVWQIPPEGYRPERRISILVPMRNEAESIAACIESLQAQSYPEALREIIILDDRSTDESADIAHKYVDKHTRLLSMAELDPDYPGPAFKKRALDIGVQSSTGHYILTTDADCTQPANWAATLVSYAEAHQSVYLSGPVMIAPADNLIEKYQALDALGMAAVNGSGMHRGTRLIPNGANALFSRAVYHELGGMEDISDMASGDDVFLAQKMAARYPERIGYARAREAIVRTTPETSWQDIIHQRVRWAGKFRRGMGSDTQRLMLFIAGVHMFLLVALCLGILYHRAWLGAALLLLFLKLRVEYWYLRQLSGRFDQRSALKAFFPAAMLSIPINIYVSIRSLLSPKIEWKDRTVR